MPILSTTPARNKMQVVYQHVLSGIVYGPFVEFRPTAEDHEAWFTAKEESFLTSLKRAEIGRNIAVCLSEDPTPTFRLQHSTVVENGLALREVYKVSSGRDAYRIGWVVHGFGWTDNQLNTRFGLTDAQIPAARAKLLDLSLKYEQMLEGAGE